MTTPVPHHLAGQRCSDLARASGEAPMATAPVAVGWLIIEQPGPWGRDAVTESRLEPALAADLVRDAGAAGMRVALMRRPGGRLAAEGRRRVILAHTRPGATWVETFDVADLAVLRDIDLAAVARGAHPNRGPEVAEPLVLVCTNAKRDQCCALRGRPLARELAAAHPEAVWECSHLGGHRFAPTALVLPTGYVYGYLTPDAAHDVFAEATAGRVVLRGLRGRSTWSRTGQAAEIAVREAIGELRSDALSVAAVTRRQGEITTIGVSHVDGRRWDVDVRIVTGAWKRPEACGGAPKPVEVSQVVSMRAAQPGEDRPIVE